MVVGVLAFMVKTCGTHYSMSYETLLVLLHLNLVSTSFFKTVLRTIIIVFRFYSKFFIFQFYIFMRFVIFIDHLVELMMRYKKYVMDRKSIFEK